MSENRPVFAGEPAVDLGPGVAMPLVGLGVWQMRDGRAAEDAVGWALEAGYRQIDTAAAYGNEASVGRAVRNSGLPRGDVFITTKMRSREPDPERALAQSLERLGLDYVDLYLIHSPGGDSERHWPAFADLRSRGLTRCTGVSNWSDSALERLVERAEVPRP